MLTVIPEVYVSLATAVLQAITANELRRLRRERTLRDDSQDEILEGRRQQTQRRREK